MKRFNSIMLSTLTAAILVGCGGGGSGSSTPTVLTGTFVDAPVQGLYFKTATQEGYTDATGKFKYITGETVEFKLGNLSLGSVSADATITPYTLGNSDSSNPSDKTKNIVVLLQSFDADSTDEILDVSNLKDIDLAKDFSLSDTPETNEGNVSSKLADNSFVISTGIKTPNLINSTTAISNMNKYLDSLKPTFTLTTEMISGKSMTVTDSEGTMTALFNVDKTYSESWDDTISGGDKGTCSATWSIRGNKVIISGGTCENTEITLTEAPKTGSEISFVSTDDSGTATISSISGVSSKTTTSDSKVTLTTEMISGKQLTFTDASDTVVGNFFSNGTYYETFTNVESTTGNCYGLWSVENGKLIINSKCSDSNSQNAETTSVTLNASPAVDVEGKAVEKDNRTTDIKITKVTNVPSDWLLVSKTIISTSDTHFDFGPYGHYFERATDNSYSCEGKWSYGNGKEVNVGCDNETGKSIVFPSYTPKVGDTITMKFDSVPETATITEISPF